MGDKGLKILNRSAWGVVVITFVYPWLIKWLFAWKWGVDIHEMGTVGDFIGGTAAPYLNFASFLLLYGALKVQQTAMNVQQNELKTQQYALIAQQEELKLTREVFQEQSITMARQRFESTFFNMITLHSQNANSLNLKIASHIPAAFVQGSSLGDELYEGRRVISYIFGQFAREFEKLDDSQKDNFDLLVLMCDNHYLRYEGIVSHYYKHILNTIAFVQTDAMTDSDRRKFSSVIFAQLSKTEITALCYVIFSDKDYLELIRDYNLSWLIDPSYLLREEHYEYLKQPLTIQT